jgi:hypothetical protein
VKFHSTEFSSWLGLGRWSYRTTPKSRGSLLIPTMSLEQGIEEFLPTTEIRGPKPSDGLIQVDDAGNEVDRCRQLQHASKTETAQALAFALQVFKRLFLKHFVALEEFIDQVAGFKT